MKNSRLITAFAVLAAVVVAGSCAKKVSSVSKVVITPATIALSEGERATLKAVVTPDNLSQAVSWRSLNESIATVDAEGNVLGIRGGKTYVTASASGSTAGCLVTVMAHVEGVTLDCHEAEIDLDGVKLLTAKVLPENSYNDTVFWASSDKSIAMVGNGLVTGMSVGDAYISVTTAEGGFKDSCLVHVTCSVKGISLNKTATKINVGSCETLTATITPADATHQEVRWVSSDESVASVDASGNVSGLGRGTCTITAYSFADGYSASCEVEVYAAVTGVQLAQHSLQMYVGDRVNLQANVIPADANNPAVTWTTSSATYAKVNSATGAVTAVKAGSATITVKTTEGKFTDECVVTIVQGTAAVSGVSLDKTSLHLRVNGTYELYAKITPADAADKKVIWSSSNTTVASVGSDGKVTGKDAGTAVITAKTNDGGFIATCTVTVVGFDSTTGGLDDEDYIWN